jgi:hypothetical protein
VLIANIAANIGGPSPMGHWGVKSFENDDAADALDAGFDRVHGATYDALMDDRNPLSLDQIQKQLASPDTLAAAIGALEEAVGQPLDDWEETARLAFVGVVVRHAEFGVAIPDEFRMRALDWLEHEEIDWQEATLRHLRRAKEAALLHNAAPS